MGPINLALWGLGVALMVVGYMRARGPYARYQEMKSQEANIARYEGWRGSRLRDDGPSAAALLAKEFLRKAQLAGLIVIAGLVLVFAGFAIR